MKIHPAHRKLHAKLRQVDQHRQSLNPAQKAVQDAVASMTELAVEKIRALFDADTIKAAGLYPADIAALMATSPVIALLTVFRNANLKPHLSPTERRLFLRALVNQIMDFVPQYMATTQQTLNEQTEFDYEIEISGQPFDINQPCPSPDAN